MDLVEVGRSRFTKSGNSLYILAPACLRWHKPKTGDEVRFFKAPGSDDVIMRVSKLIKSPQRRAG